MLIDKPLIDHLQRHIDDDGEAQIGDPAKTLDIMGDDIRRDAHQGDRQDQADHEDPGMVARRAGHGQTF